MTTHRYNVNDRVKISPVLTHADGWLRGSVIDVEQNPFNGIVISAETATGDVFTGRPEEFEAL